MAKDTPNKPDDVKASPAAEHPEQAAPVADPPPVEIPPVGEVVISADKINELAGGKRKAAKPKQPSQDEQGQEAPVGKAVQTGEKAAHTPEHYEQTIQHHLCRSTVVLSWRRERRSQAALFSDDNIRDMCFACAGTGCTGLCFIFVGDVPGASRNL